MHISEMAAKLNLTPRAIRYYEEKGLLDPPKAGNRYRTFTEKEAWRLQAIASLREVGMPTERIAAVLANIERGEQGEVRKLLDMQRSLLFAQLVGTKQLIETLDGMIGGFDRDEAPPIERLYELAETSKRVREVRERWQDRWQFDRRAETYDVDVRPDGLSHALHREYEEALAETVRAVAAKPGEYGLDLGTGTGNLAGKLAAAGIRMAGVDQSVEMLRRCEAKFPAVQTRLGNMLAVPFFDGQFDFVVTSYALHHLSDAQKPLALAEIDRVLKPHGRLAIADLMSAGEAQRVDWAARLRREGNEYAARETETEHYAELSAVTGWLASRGYVVGYRRFGELLHVVQAVKGSAA